MLLGRELTVRQRVARVALWTVVAVAVPFFWYLLGRGGMVSYPRASSWFGVLTGLVGAAIIFFEIALWGRKRRRGQRWGPTKLWLWWHIVLGWAVLPVIVVHSGFAWGGMVSATTMILFLLVIASGIYGLLLQQWIPQRLLELIPDETVATQIDYAIEKHRTEARLIVEELVPRDPNDPSPVWMRAIVTGVPALRLQEFRENTLDPYLNFGRKMKSPLNSRQESSVLFNRLRAELPENAHVSLAKLERLADLRRQWDDHARLHAFLHGWLLFHAPISVAMAIFMVFHAIKALKYW
ncbi:hypothetical protein [Limnoglobus roseus]|nr:hypothetical protein [Limnoglobus roseus]